MRYFFLKTLCGIVLSSFLISPPSICFAIEGKKTTFPFTIRQEKLYQNGIWISHPKPSDEQIVSLLRINSIQSLEAYTQWLKANTFYQKDRIDSWASPQETFRKRYGDCEDYAFLSAEVLRVLGYQAHVFTLKTPHQNHAVCAFQKNGYYLWFDNNHLKKTDATNLKDLAKTILKEYSFSHLLEYQDQTKDWKTLYKISLN